MRLRSVKNSDAPAVLRYQGRSPQVVRHRWFLLSVWFVVTVLQVQQDAGRGVLISVVLLAPALVIRLWRSWPSITLIDNAPEPEIRIRNWATTRAFPANAATTLLIRTERKWGDKRYGFRLASPVADVRSRAYVGGAGGVAEIHAFAERWRRSGGHVVGEPPTPKHGISDNVIDLRAVRSILERKLDV